MKNRASALFVDSIYDISLSPIGLHDSIYKENYKTKYLRLFTPFPNLITKESYNWWVTRRKWGFRHQISEAKNLKNVGRKYLEALRRILQACKMATKFHSMKDTISQPKADFAALRNLPSTWSDRLPMAVTSSFQL